MRETAKMAMRIIKKQLFLRNCINMIFLLSLKNVENNATPFLHKPDALKKVFTPVKTGVQMLNNYSKSHIGFQIEFIPHLIRDQNDGKRAFLTFFEPIKPRLILFLMLCKPLNILFDIQHDCSLYTAIHNYWINENRNNYFKVMQGVSLCQRPAI